MALEDVDYLYNHSQKKSYMFYIDSKDRNKELYPHPNNYAITFSAPFKNVYSLEILDASIPRTQHAIDSHNNKLVFVYNYNKNVNSDPNTIHTITIPVGDYDSKNLIIVLNNQFKILGFSIEIDDLTIPADERSVFVFKSDKPLLLDMKRSTVATVLGFDLLSLNNEFDEEDQRRFDILDSLDELTNYDNTITIPTKPDSNDYSNNETYNNELEKFNIEIKLLNKHKNKVFKSTNKGINYYKRTEDFVGPLNINTSLRLNINDANDLDKDSNLSSYNAIAQEFKINNDNSFLSTIELNCNDFRSISFSIDYFKRDGNNELVSVDHISPTSFTKAAEESTITLDITHTNNPFEKGDKVLVVFYTIDSTKTNISMAVNLRNSANTDEKMYVFTYDTQNSINNTSMYQITLDDNGKFETTQDDDVGTYHMCINIVTKTKLEKIEAPGMYSLIGDRYAILRCPEIEQHLFASHSYERYSMGLAKFKLAVLGYDESRFDFASLPPREFHPIGKLSQMTFRFERPDGGLYNFRGVNHTITLAIRYMVPIQTETFQKYILNPKYDPDFFRYQQNQESDDEMSD
jgi:hypothetical protein